MAPPFFRLPRKLLRRKKLFLALLAALLICANGLYHIIQPVLAGSDAVAASGGTVVHFISVGQGDSELIQSGGEAVLIDAGPGVNAQNEVAYLQKQGVRRLQAVIATHPHEDHIGGLPAVLQAFPVDKIYMPNCVTTTSIYGQLLDSIEAHGVKTVVPSPGDVFRFSSGATLRFLSPRPNAVYKDLNNYSLVTMLTTGSHRILFMGDAEAPIEQSLLHSDLSCEVLKVGHHGSRTSSTPAFLRRLGAHTAIISCGKDNTYGFPHRETLTNLQNAGITDIRRTDLKGTIVLRFPASELQQKEASAA